MTTVARRNPEDSARIKAIEEKLLANPEMAKLIGELGTSTTDANDLVRGLLQASINRGLNAEMDVHLGYEHGDRDGKQSLAREITATDTTPSESIPTMGPSRLLSPGTATALSCPRWCPKDHVDLPTLMT